MDFSLVPENKDSGILAVKKNEKREKKGSPHKNVIATQKKKDKRNPLFDSFFQNLSFSFIILMRVAYFMLCLFMTTCFVKVNSKRDSLFFFFAYVFFLLKKGKWCFHQFTFFNK